MNRSEGLVRRVKARDTESNSGGGGSTSSNYDQENKNNEVEDEMEDCDSKETRLTLMEEVLLLGLKDKEVRFPAHSHWRHFFDCIFIIIGYPVVRDNVGEK